MVGTVTTPRIATTITIHECSWPLSNAISPTNLLATQDNYKRHKIHSSSIPNVLKVKGLITAATAKVKSTTETAASTRDNHPRRVVGSGGGSGAC